LARNPSRAQPETTNKEEAIIIISVADTIESTSSLLYFSRGDEASGRFRGALSAQSPPLTYGRLPTDVYGSGSAQDSRKVCVNKYSFHLTMWFQAHALVNADKCFWIIDIPVI
jgi:hypothetical protein